MLVQCRGTEDGHSISCLGVLSTGPSKTIDGDQNIDEFIKKLFPSKPTQKNPGLIRCYQIPESIRNQVSLPFVDVTFEDRPITSMMDLLQRELDLVQVMNCWFSRRAIPDLYFYQIHEFPIEHFGHVIKLSEELPKIEGIKLDATSAYGFYQLGPFTLEISETSCFLSFKGAEKGHVLEALPVAGSPLYKPAIISDPRHQTFHQLFAIIEMIESDHSDSGKTRQSVEMFRKIYTAVMESCSRNDPGLFPALSEKAELRARAISKAIQEITCVSQHLKTKELATVIKEVGKNFDESRILGQAASKRLHLDNTSSSSLGASQNEFKPMIPYLDLIRHSSSTSKFTAKSPGSKLATLSFQSLFHQVDDYRLAERTVYHKNFWN